MKVDGRSLTTLLSDPKAPWEHSAFIQGKGYQGIVTKQYRYCISSNLAARKAMRHADFATTEKYYGAMRSAQAAASEVRQKLTPDATSDAFVGGLMGGHEKTPQLSTAELSKLKRLLNSI